MPQHGHSLGLSRETRICIVLCIDIVFFLTELIIGHMVNSLAIIADSFHLLNDIMSLVVGLYAIKLSKRTTHHDADTRYTYGWHRAEILAALVNAVFLLALSFSIFVDAMSRFSDRPEVQNPKLVVIVGCAGLTSGLLGMFLFHEHGHGHSQSHSHVKEEGLEGATQTGQIADPSDHEGQISTTQRRSTKIPPNGSKSLMVIDDEDGPRNENIADDSYFGHPAATRAYVVHAAREMEHDQLEEQEQERERERGRVESGDAEKGDLSGSTDAPLPAMAALSSTTSPHSHDAPKKPKATTSGALNMRGLMLHVCGDALGNVGVIASGLVIWFAKGDWKYYMDPVASLLITAIIAFNTIPLVRSASYILLQCVPRGISLQEVGDAIRKVKGVEDVHELHIWQLSENKVVASVHVKVGKTDAAVASKGKKATSKKGKDGGEGKYSRLASMDEYDDGASDIDEKGDGVQVSTMECPHTLADVRDRDFMRVAAEIRRRLHDRGIHSSTIQPEYAGDEDADVAGGTTRGARLAAGVIAKDGTRSKRGWFGRWRKGGKDGNLDVELGAGTNTGTISPSSPTATQTPSCLITCPPDQEECNPAENACCPPPKLIDV